jgi:hypothetical protein
MAENKELAYLICKLRLGFGPVFVAIQLFFKLQTEVRL